MQGDISERRIPLPPDFPVEWADPHEVDRFFERESQHFPGQMSTLEFALAEILFGGFNGGCEHYGLPVRNTFKEFNTYGYQSIAPISHDREELEKLGRAAVGNTSATFGKMADTWESEQLPEIKKLIEFWEDFDASAASNDDLAEHLDGSIERLSRAWLIHFHVVFPVLLGASMFDDLYTEIFGGEDGFAAYRLLQGLDNMSLKADRALYVLSDGARASADVRSALGLVDTAAVLGALDGSDEGRTFRTELNGFLDKFGKRHDGHLSASKPSWTEDPTPVLDNVRDYVEQPERDPRAEQAAHAAERERALAEARTKLAGKPTEVRERFELLLKAGQDGTVLQEDHNFWIDGRVAHETRQLVVALGARLKADGVIASAGDVIHLTLEEIRGALSGGDLSGSVGERKAHLARFADVAEPPVLGTFPPGPPPDDPIARAVFKMFGAPPPPSEEAEVVTGMSGSAGVAKGRARVINSLAEAGDLVTGEVLVTATTSPPWTPLFATAAAVVTDTGGILSHCAVVAREYAIPAVVGTKRATAVIQTGDFLEVNGDAGTVRIGEGT
jgi:phosphohistidine swiveling domain-containing protein